MLRDTNLSDQVRTLADFIHKITPVMISAFDDLLACQSAASGQRRSAKICIN